MHDIAVVGSGMGGSMIAAMLSAKGFDVALFEKEPYFGGASGGFSHKSHTYNTGATTFVGYGTHDLVRHCFDIAQVTPPIIKSTPAMCIVQEGIRFNRSTHIDDFIASMQAHYPNQAHETFWRTCKKISLAFLQEKDIFYSTRSFKDFIKTLHHGAPLFWRYKSYLFTNAHKALTKEFGTMPQSFWDFIDAQVQIVAQTTLKNTNLLTALLALGYTFSDTYYAKGGMQAIFAQLTSKVTHTFLSHEIIRITHNHNFFTLYTKTQTFRAKNVILNTPLFSSAALFSDAPIVHYYKNFATLDNNQSAFVVYMRIKSDTILHHHYQHICHKIFKHTISKSIFISVSDKEDSIMTQDNIYTLTVSIHTRSSYWQNKATYKQQKLDLQNSIIDTVCQTLGIHHDAVITAFSATPTTFKRYINRSQLGGNIMRLNGFIPFIAPQNATPFEGLYHVGDTAFAAQGFAGVTIGVYNVYKQITQQSQPHV